MYFDYAAATPMDKKVLAAMTPYFANDFYNPSAAYAEARKVRADYEDARHKLAQTIGAKPTETIMTAGATESINLAFASFNNIITTAIEHPAVLECAKKVRPPLGSDLQTVILSVDETGRIKLDELKKTITDETQFISVGYVNNEIGTAQPIKEIAAICASVREKRLERGINTPLVFHTDASQAAGLLDINVARLGVDLMTLNAGKCYGPKQVGLLYVRSGIELKPLILGGGQESGLRSGTENVAGAVGFSVALELAEKHRKSESNRLELIRSDLIKYITTHILQNGVRPQFGEVKINGSKKFHSPAILNFSVPGLDGERAVFALDQRGIQVATGSACAANKGLQSHVLQALGLQESEANGSLRISIGRGTTKQEIEKLKPILKKVIETELKLS